MATAISSYGEDDKDNDGIIAFFHKLKLGVFGLLYTMSKSADEGYWFSITWFLVEFFQVLSFHFPLAFEASIHLKEVFGWQSSTDWLGYFSAFFHLIPFIILSEVATTVFFAASLFVVSGMVSISLFVIVQFTLNNFKTMWTLKLLRATAGTFFYNFFYYFNRNNVWPSIYSLSSFYQPVFSMPSWTLSWINLLDGISFIYCNDFNCDGFNIYFDCFALFCNFLFARSNFWIIGW